MKEKHVLEAWQIEAAAIDRSVRILPEVPEAAHGLDPRELLRGRDFHRED